MIHSAAIAPPLLVHMDLVSPSYCHAPQMLLTAIVTIGYQQDQLLRVLYILGLSTGLPHCVGILHVCVLDQVEPTMAGKASILGLVYLRILYTQQVVTVIGAVLSGANVVGYVKCRKDAGTKLTSMAGQLLGQQILKQVTTRSDHHCYGKLIT